VIIYQGPRARPPKDVGAKTKLKEIDVGDDAAKDSRALLNAMRAAWVRHLHAQADAIAAGLSGEGGSW
jgi:hypothetical protein